MPKLCQNPVQIGPVLCQNPDRFRWLGGSVSPVPRVHLQLHLRVFLENLLIALPEQLRDPLVSNAAGAEPGGVCRSEIVDAKISNLRPAKRRMPNGLECFLKAVRIFFAREEERAGP